MATSGNFTTNNASGLSGGYPNVLRFEWWQNSQDIAGNYTDIGWRFVVAGGKSGYYTYCFGGSITVDGQTFNLPVGNYYEGQVIASGTKRVYHNNDGTKNFSASGGANLYAASRWSGGSGSWSLNNIPRHCSATGANGNITDEENPWISYSNPAGASLRVKLELPDLGIDPIAGTDGSIGSPKTGKYTWNLSEAVRNTIRTAMKNVKSTKIRMTIYDSVGGTTSYSYKDATISIVNANPVFSKVNYRDTNTTIVNLTGNNQILVQGKSKLAVVIPSADKAVAKKSTTMSKYIASISGLSAEAGYSTSDVNILFDSSNFVNGTQSLAVKAIDVRGISTTVSQNITILPYTAPKINATAIRKNNFDNETTVAISGTFSPLLVSNIRKNTIHSCTLQYKKSSTSTWTNAGEIGKITVGDDGKFTVANKVINLDNSSQWDLRITAHDKLGSTTVALVVSIGIPIFRISTVDNRVYNEEKKLLREDDKLTSQNIDFATLTLADWLVISKSNMIETTTCRGPWGTNFTLTRIAGRIIIAVWGGYTSGNMGGTGTSDEQIPTSYRPKQDTPFPITSYQNERSGWAKIRTDGKMEWYFGNALNVRASVSGVGVWLCN